MERQLRDHHRPFALLLILALGALAAFSLSGCSTLGPGYWLHAGRGQLALMNRARPIPEVLKDPRTSPRLRALLERIPEVKAYGESQGLRPTPNYVDYVALDRDAVSYVVSASERLRFRAKVWTFPIVGSFTYVGWFDRESAESYAREIEKEDLDVAVRGAPAFSTLGWFRDPVVSSMIPEGASATGELAEVLLHESVHTTLYVNGQSTFNESLADFVARKLTPGYLEKAYGRDSPELKAYLESQERSLKGGALLSEAYRELERLYSGSLPDAEKAEKKAKVLERLNATWGGKRGWNNASLIQFRTYGTGVDAFERVWAKAKGDPRAFLALLKPLEDGKRFPEPQTEDFSPVLNAL